MEANNFYKDGEFLKSQILYEIVLPYYKGKKEAEELYYKFAYTHYHLEDYILAAHYFKSYSNSFTNSSHREECLYMSAYSEYVMSPKSQLDQTQTNKAIDDFQYFVNTFPESDKVEKCNTLIDELRKKLEIKAFEQGQLYYNIGKYVSSIVSLENMLRDFPETAKEEEIRFLILQASYNYAKNSIFEKKIERYKDTIERYNQYIKRFSNSKNIKKAKKIYNDSLAALK
jgi:outer membrane protein assembly factor BamD